jgi:hypothetical protein
VERNGYLKPIADNMSSMNEMGPRCHASKELVKCINKVMAHCSSLNSHLSLDLGLDTDLSSGSEFAPTHLARNWDSLYLIGTARILVEGLEEEPWP